MPVVDRERRPVPAGRGVGQDRQEVVPRPAVEAPELAALVPEPQGVRIGGQGNRGGGVRRGRRAGEPDVRREEPGLLQGVGRGRRRLAVRQARGKFPSFVSVYPAAAW